MRKSKRPKLTAGFVREVRGNPAEAQEAALAAAGVRVIYRAAKGEKPTAAKHRVRGRGEALAVSGGLRVLADKRKEMRAVVDVFHRDDGGVFDIATERDTRTHGLEMFDDAQKAYNGEARVPDPEKHLEYQSAGGKARAKKYRKGRMTKRDALPIWRDGDLKTEQALEIIGWSRAAAYDVVKGLGPRGVRTGRKTKET